MFFYNKINSIYIIVHDFSILPLTDILNLIVFICTFEAIYTIYTFKNILQNVYYFIMFT